MTALTLWVLLSTPLQPLLDATPVKGTLTLEPKTYSGPAHIDKPLTLKGQGATLEGDGQSTVLSIAADDVTVEGLTLAHSGQSNDRFDAAIEVTGQRATLKHLTIRDVLFGIHLKGSHDSLVCGNVVTSNGEEAGLRGDGIRVWNGSGNRIIGNQVTLARDVSFSNAPDNLVKQNVIEHGRTGVMLVFSPRVKLEDNWLDGNLTGVAVLYSNDVTLSRNRVQHSRGNAGTGLTFKESSHGTVRGNEILHCGVGARTNSPTSPDNVVTFEDNVFAHDIAALDFYGENGGHQLHHNRFVDNLSQVTVSAPMAARGNDWSNNSWDDYEGFDENHDGIGDFPHEQWWFADRIFMETPQATFFRNSPALELLDLLERLAPFSTPELVLRDDKPLVRTPPHTDVTRPSVPFCP